MIIKPPDDHRPRIAHLDSVLDSGEPDSLAREPLESELRELRGAANSAREAEYEIGFHYADSRHWAVLHDLRLERAGRIAHIDHLIINRFLDIWCCTSRHFSEGIAIDDDGKCSAFQNSRAYRVRSPLERNRADVALLDTLFRERGVKPPRRFGVALRPNVRSLVLVSKGGWITRPKTPIEDIDTIIRNVDLKDRIAREDSGALAVGRLVGPSALAAFARRLAALHHRAPPVDSRVAARRAQEAKDAAGDAATDELAAAH